MSIGSAPLVVEKRKPVFTKVDRLQLEMNGHTLTVKVVSSKSVPVNARANRSSSNAVLSRPPPCNTSIAVCLVRDEP
ncbi:hypothetical protein NL676_020014 [Syzygium grande]|nr:hypothetical protein NL676_020014 [Syzygium grande]